MRKRILIVLTVALLLGLGASAGLADSSRRPFKGRVSKSIVSYPAGTCPGESSYFEVEGTIIATHMGKGTMTEVGCTDLVECDAYPICWFRLYPGTSTFTFVAANGDELHGSLDGYFWQNVDAGYGGGTFQGEFTGGTGRFAGAQGTVVKEWTGQGTPSGDVIDSWWDGVIGD